MEWNVSRGRDPDNLLLLHADGGEVENGGWWETSSVLQKVEHENIWERALMLLALDTLLLLILFLL